MFVDECFGLVFDEKCFGMDVFEKYVISPATALIFEHADAFVRVFFVFCVF